MDKIEILGGRRLAGEVVIGGAKNAALPALFACLLTEGECALTKVPHLRDIHSALAVLQAMGARCDMQGDCVTVQAERICSQDVQYELVKLCALQC